MKNYYELKAEKERVKNELKLAQRRENQNLREKYPKWFKTLDIILLITFLANLGAYLGTKTMIAMTTPEPRVVESNPVTAEVQDLPTSKQANFNWVKFLIHFTLLGGIIGFMFYQRAFMTSYWELWLYTAMVTFFSSVLILDFLSNASMLLGLWLK